MRQLAEEYFVSLQTLSVRPTAARIAMLAVALYAFFWLAHYEVARVAEGLLILLFVISMANRRNSTTVLLREPLFWLFVLWLLLQVYTYVQAAKLFPEWQDGQVTVARHYSKVFMVLVLAWWMAGSVKTTLLLYCLAFVGFIVGVTLSDELVLDIQRILAHERVDFGYRNWEHLSVYSAFFFLVLVFFWRRLLAVFHDNWVWAGYLLLAGWLVVCITGIIGSQTRATWLGLSVALGVASAGYITRLWRRQKHAGEVNRRNYLRYGSGGALLMVVVAVLLVKFDTSVLVEKRLEREQGVVALLLEGRAEEVPYTSIGIRIQSWRRALGWVAERPLTGWGPKSAKPLIAQSDMPDYIKEVIGHLHNSYIELAVAYGFVGVAFFMVIFVILGYRAWWAWRRGLMPDDLFFFLGTFMIYWLIVNMFESYLMYSTGIYINALIGGAAYTFYISKKAECGAVT
ncbi:MAG: O-antigen ligase family protein [Pseudomonadota bacterium]